ncbi:hypothetical protein [Criibacterium bergeronii]|nr:hypothetical protein [Criibacterium bergeronii]
MRFVAALFLKRNKAKLLMYILLMQDKPYMTTTESLLVQVLK